MDSFYYSRIDLLIRRVLKAGWPALLVILFIGGGWHYENYTGAKRWEKVKNRFEDEGLISEISGFNPSKMPPEDKNFIAHPLIHSCFEFELDADNEPIYHKPELRERFLRMTLPGLEAFYASHEDKEDYIGSWQRGSTVNLTWCLKQIDLNKTYKPKSGKEDATEFLSAIAFFADDIDSVDQAARRKFSVAPTSYGSSLNNNIFAFSPWANDLDNFAFFQKSRGIANLKTNNPDVALNSVIVLKRISEIRSKISDILDILALGIDWGIWERDDYSKLDEILLDLNPLEQSINSMNFKVIGDLAAGIDSLKNGEELPFWNRPPQHYSKIRRLLPAGVYDHNKAIGAEFILEQSILRLQKKDVISPQSFNLRPNPRTFLIETFIQYQDLDVKPRVIYSIYRDLALVSCAIESFRLGHSGEIPKSLNDLVPRYISEIPKDPWNPPTPIKYLADHKSKKYRIYSIGENRIDDGGVVEWRDNGTRNTRIGDIVWGIPILRPPPPKSTE